MVFGNMGETSEVLSIPFVVVCLTLAIHNFIFLSPYLVRRIAKVKTTSALREQHLLYKPVVQISENTFSGNNRSTKEVSIKDISLS